MAGLVKPSSKLTFRDRLSQLSFEKAAKLLGDDGKKLILKGSAREVRLREDVYLGGDLFRVSFPSPAGGMEAIATLTVASDAPNGFVGTATGARSPASTWAPCSRSCWRQRWGSDWPPLRRSEQ